MKDSPRQVLGDLRIAGDLAFLGVLQRASDDDCWGVRTFAALALLAAVSAVGTAGASAEGLR